MSVLSTRYILPRSNTAHYRGFGVRCTCVLPPLPMNVPRGTLSSYGSMERVRGEGEGEEREEGGGGLSERCGDWLLKFL